MRFSEHTGGVDVKLWLTTVSAEGVGDINPVECD